MPWVEARLSFSFPNFSTSLRSSELDAQSVLLARRSAELGRLKVSPPAVAQGEKRRREPLTAGGCLGRPAPSALLFTCLVPPAALGPTSFLLPPPLGASLRWLSACPRYERTARPGSAAGNWQGWRSEEVPSRLLRIPSRNPALPSARSAPLRSGALFGPAVEIPSLAIAPARSDPTAAPPLDGPSG